jgi:ketosteroid isomerase-like protein
VTSIKVSRRTLLVAAAFPLAQVAGLPGPANSQVRSNPTMTNQEIIRNYYAAWEKKDWGRMDVLLAENFTFTSANNDDHISKSAFKAQCWKSQVDFIQRFELERVIGNGDDAFVKYLCRTTNGKSFRNVEYFLCHKEKIEAIESYFGAQSNFPSAVSTRS